MEIYRRHTQDCPHRGKGSGYMRCTCPLWVDAMVDGRRIRRSLQTASIARAMKKASDLVADPGKVDAIAPGKRIDAAVEHYLAHVKPDIAPSTWSKRRTALMELARYAADQGVIHLVDLTLERLDGLRDWRQLAPLTWSRELEILRHFYRFAMRRKWCRENVAAEMDGPKNPPLVRERMPFSPAELVSILAAAGQYGDSAYSRLRARALVLILRHTALRLGDAVQLRRDAIQDGRLVVITEKKKRKVSIRLCAELRQALEMLPLPIGAAADCPYFLWNGNSRNTAVKDAGRMLAKIFKRAGVESGHAHRFRHTLAAEILSKGGTAEEVATFLGDSPAVVRDHYAKWTTDRQDRLDELVSLATGGTFAVHTPDLATSGLDAAFSLVPVVGLEPTTLGL
jgi:site-specific recombinase XerD